MAEDKYVVDGFRFKTKEELAEAKNEYEGVTYMKGRTNMNNPANVYSVYKSLVEKKVFKTPVGMKFLYELQDNLYKSGKYTKEDLDSIIIEIPDKKLSAKQKKKELKASKKEVIRSMKELDIESVYRNRFINVAIMNVLLIIVIAVIIAITSNSENINILNYKNRIDAEYNDRENSLVKWKNELNELEKALKEKEKALTEREKELENEPTDETN